MLRNPKKFILATFIALTLGILLKEFNIDQNIISYGFPIEFSARPVNSKSLLDGLNIFGLVLNIAVYYFLITIINNYIQKYKKANH